MDALIESLKREVDFLRNEITRLKKLPYTVIDDLVDERDAVRKELSERNKEVLKLNESVDEYTMYLLSKESRIKQLN